MNAMNARERSEESQAVADEIRAQRARHGLTQRQVYEQAGMTKQTYERIEKGQRVTDVTQLAKIAAVFDMTGSELYARADAELQRKRASRATE